MKPVQRVKGVVDAKGTVKVLERVDLPAGACEVLVLPVGSEKIARTPELKPLKSALEGLIGLWADRHDITDSAEYAVRLRETLQIRRDRRAARARER